MQKRTKYWLIIIFLLALTIRLILSFITPNLTYESYFHLRQVEHITETGLPIYQDALSYGGREIIFLPTFHYVMAFFNLFIPLNLLVKIIPNLLLASLTLIIFFIAEQVTKNEKGALLSALIAGFLPILYTTNQFTVECMFLPLTFLTIFFFLKIKEPTYVYLYLISFLFLGMLSPSTFLLLIGFLIYLILSFVENKKINKAELELILFSLFFFIWAQFIFFKDVLIKEGISFIWQNVPSVLLTLYFPKISIIESIILVSFIPFLAGIYVVYKSLFELKGQKTFFLISLVISTLVLSWFGLITQRLSLTFFGLVLSVLFASFYKDLSNYLDKTKISWVEKYLMIIIIILLSITMLIPALNTSIHQDTPTNEEITAFKWIADNTPTEAGVVASLKEGNLVTYFSKRRNLMDEQFSSIKDIDKRFLRLNSVFTTKFQTYALDTFTLYDLNYLVLTPATKERYNITKIDYTDGKCFKRIYQNETIIYLVKCEVEEK